MFSQFDDNPLADEREAVEVTSPGTEPADTQKREREEEMPAEEAEVGGPKSKSPRLENDAAQSEGPYFGYSVDDGDEVGDADETYGSLLCRVAVLESGRRSSARAHRFQMNLRAAEGEAIRGCMGRLRALLMSLQELRTKSPASSQETRSNSNQFHSPQLIELYNRAEQREQFAKCTRWLRSGRPSVITVEPGGSSWLPEPEVIAEGDNSPRQPIDLAQRQCREVLCALGKIPPEGLGPITPVINVLGSKLQQICKICDTLYDVKAGLESQVHKLAAQWNRHSLWGMERSLLAAEEQMIGYLDALNPTSKEEQICAQHQQMQKRIQRAEVAVATLLISASDIKLPKVQQKALQHALQRYEELQKLRAGLYQEVVFLRKFLKDKLVLATRSMTGGKYFFLGSQMVDEGRASLLQHCCAILYQRTNELRKGLIREALSGSLACPPQPAQEEQLLQYEARVSKQHATIVSLLNENMRLHSRVKDASLIQLLAAHDTVKCTSLAEKLQATVTRSPVLKYASQPGVAEEAAASEEGGNETECDGTDMLELLVGAFSKGVDELGNCVNAKLESVSSLYDDERKLQKDIALLVRLTVAGEQLLHGKVDVDSTSGCTEDIAAPLEENSLHLKGLHFAIKHLPSIDVLREALQAQSRSHAEQLATQYGDAEKTRAALVEDLEWCKQQSSHTTEAELLEARKELKQLKVSVAAVTAQEHDHAPLELEILKVEEQLAEYQRQLAQLQEMVDTAECELQTRANDEVVGARSVDCGVGECNEEKEIVVYETNREEPNKNSEGEGLGQGISEDNVEAYRTNEEEENEEHDEDEENEAGSNE